MGRLAGGIILYSSFLVGPPNAGWTSYVPLSDRSTRRIRSDLWILSLTVLEFSSTFGALNMIVTSVSLRAPGMTFHHITLFTSARNSLRAAASPRSQDLQGDRSGAPFVAGPPNIRATAGAEQRLKPVSARDELAGAQLVAAGE